MKYRWYYIVFLTFFILSGCTYNISRNEEEPPADLIPRDTMVDIITDIHLFDAVLKEKQKRHKKMLEYKYRLYQTILEKYDITREQFESSLKYYQQNLEEFDKMYEDVIEKLSKMQAEVSSKSS